MGNNTKVTIVNKSNHALPAYQTPGAAGMDLRAWVSEPMPFKPMERKLVPTGIYIALPVGYEAQIRPRSGMAINKGLTVVNAPGTIDSDYRGEVKIAMINISGDVQVIENGDRIAQMIVARYEVIEWNNVAELEQTERGEGGFGHTGK